MSIDLYDRISKIKNQWLKRWLFRLLLLIAYVLTRLKFLLPKKFEEKLPVAWNGTMWWTAIKSGGEKIYGEYYCEIHEPPSYKPKITNVPKEYRLFIIH